MESEYTKRNICRVCLGTEKSQLFDWHTPILDLKDRLNYASLFRQLTRLKVDDDEAMPQLLCHSCASDLRSIYDFLQKAYLSDQALRSTDKGMHLVKRSGSPKETVVKIGFEWVGICKNDTTESSTVTEKLIEETVNIKVEPLGNETTGTLSDQYEIVKLENGNENFISSSPSKKQREREIRKAISSTKSTIKSNKVKKCRDSLEKDQPSKCACCDKSFSRKDLSRHITGVHKQFLCHICPRTFTQAENLRQHTLAHEGIRERPYGCELCGQKFYTKRTCELHTKTHDTNRQPHFQCDQCEKSFLHKPSLKLHQLRHKGNALECKICQKTYFRTVDLKVHMRTHSGDLPFKCPYCEKGFPLKGAYTQHVRRHEGYRYKCDTCGKEYTSQSSLICHRREHTGLPVKCGLCGKGFTKKSMLRRHIENVHKVTDPEDLEKLIIKMSTKREYRGRINKWV